MHPAYMWTDSYPHHANPTHHAPSDDRRAKEIPSHMKMDPSTLNSPYQPWPYGGNYCYPVPQECHGCCNHSYFGGPYNFRPPYPHYPPPPPFHTHGFYPPFPGAYPACSIPPPHYSIEQPRYDYDKNTHGPHHCCGCNHREDEKKSRIEREEPEVDKKTSDSLVPFLLKDYPYPVMWVPPGYLNTESGAKEKEKYSHDPVSLKPLEPSKQGRNGETTRDQQGGDGNRLPFPIFWLPSKNNEVGKDIKENNRDVVAHKGSPFSGSDDNKRPTRKIDEGSGSEAHKGSPFSESDDEKRPTRKNDEGSGSEAESEMSSRHAVKKVIPVKQLGIEEGKKSPKGIETKAESGSVEKTDNGIEGKASPKTSKLPPVCLRIDPLPRKKNSSRSPSPPGDKGRSKGSPIDNSKSSQQQTQLSEGLKKSKEEQSKGNIKTIEVTNDANKIKRDSLAGPCENVPRGEGNESEKGIVQGQSSKGEPCKAEKKNLSEHEAALIIQSAYRGFEVRKSKPLTKLRQIAGVGKQVVELRNRIQDLESSSSSICSDDKQKLIIGETIMSLLLKLDTIQGLHPIVRDVRKSVAKELVGLQEKLDSLTFVKSEAPSEETTSSTKRVMHPEDDAIQEKSDQAQAQSDSNAKLVESGMGLCENREVEATESQDDGGAEARNTNLEPQVELQNEQSTGELNNNQLQVSVETEQPIDDAIQDKFDQAQAQSDSIDEAVGLDTGICENHEVEATDSEDHGGIEAHDIKPEQLVEQSTGELNNNQVQMSVETEQPVGNAIQEKSDQAQVESNTNVETVESDTGLCEHNEVEAAESQDDGGAEAGDINLEPQVESKSQQSTEELTNNQLEMSETEQPVEQEKSDLAQAKFESHVENLESDTGVREHPEVEAKESQDDGNVQTRDINLNTRSQQSAGELDNERMEVPATPAPALVEVEKDVGMVETAEVKAELPKEDAVNGIQEDFVVLTEEAPKVDDVESSMEVLMDDLGGAPPLSPTGSYVSSGSDRKLMEENEKLRVAVEELMKAGKEQLGVIRELTGRVKDLEKKLSKKKKMKVNKCRSRGSVVEEELRSCLV